MTAKLLGWFRNRHRGTIFAGGAYEVEDVEACRDYGGNDWKEGRAGSALYSFRIGVCAAPIAKYLGHLTLLPVSINFSTSAARISSVRKARWGGAGGDSMVCATTGREGATASPQSRSEGG